MVVPGHVANNMNNGKDMGITFHVSHVISLYFSWWSLVVNHCVNKNSLWHDHTCMCKMTHTSFVKYGVSNS